MSRPRQTFLKSENSDLRRVYEELGGPAPIRDGVDRTTFDRVCKEYPLRRVLPLIERWSKSEVMQHRHWPWIALAADQYALRPPAEIEAAGWSEAEGCRITAAPNGSSCKITGSRSAHAPRLDQCTTQPIGSASKVAPHVGARVPASKYSGIPAARGRPKPRSSIDFLRPRQRFCRTPYHFPGGGTDGSGAA
jgi:hypothetical protein